MNTISSFFKSIYSFIADKFKETRFFAIMLVMSTFVILLPDGIKEKIYICNLDSDIYKIVGIMFLISISYYLIYCIEGIYNYISKKIKKIRQQKQDAIEVIKELQRKDRCFKFLIIHFYWESIGKFVPDSIIDGDFHTEMIHKLMRMNIISCNSIIDNDTYVLNEDILDHYNAMLESGELVIKNGKYYFKNNTEYFQN